MLVKTDLKNALVTETELKARRSEAIRHFDTLWECEMDYTGWVKLPYEMDEAKLAEINEVASEIRSRSDVFLVLGIGGSYMGAKAVIDQLGSSSETEVVFSGYNFSGRQIKEILSYLDGKEVSLCVISKSGGTTETLAAYGIYREYMQGRYGEEGAAKRTCVITENKSNNLSDMARADGCRIIDMPDGVGGRYSVLTAVGLLPIAVAGIDINAMIDAARKCAEAFRTRVDECVSSGDPESCELFDYAIARQLIANKGRKVEIYESYDPYTAYFIEWLKQLYGESEGKEGKGIMPSGLMFSRDLHSMGQFIQEGTPMMFETVIFAEEAEDDVKINQSGMESLVGKSIEALNECARKGVVDAHVQAGVPVIEISVPKLSVDALSELIYFFEMECAISSMLIGVCPFDQPGVEAYKKEMKAYIAKL